MVGGCGWLCGIVMSGMWVVLYGCGGFVGGGVVCVGGLCCFFCFWVLVFGLLVVLVFSVFGFVYVFGGCCGGLC